MTTGQMAAQIPGGLGVGEASGGSPWPLTAPTARASSAWRGSAPLASCAWLTELLERFDPVGQDLLPPERREPLFLLVERATVSEGEVQLVLRGTVR